MENAEVLRLALLAPFDCAQGRQDDHGFGCAHHKFLIGWPEKCRRPVTGCECRMIPRAELGAGHHLSKIDTNIRPLCVLFVSKCERAQRTAVNELLDLRNDLSGLVNIIEQFSIPLPRHAADED